MRKFSYEKQIQKQQRRENPKRAGNAPRPPIDCAPTPSPRYAAYHPMVGMPCAKVIIWRSHLVRQTL